MYDVSPSKPLSPKENINRLFKKAFDSGFNLLQTLVMIGAVLVILYLLLISPHKVDGQSMNPTYVNEEYVIASKVAYKLGDPKKGDVVIFKFSETRDFIKRIIAVQGDSVELRNGNYVVNGEQISEDSYLRSPIYTSGGSYLREGELLTIPEGFVFVSGDNRPYSSDSREFGPVEVERIKGKVFVVVFPLGSIRLAK